MLDKKDSVMATDSRYFAQKAIDAADELWDKGLIDENTIEQWKHEHMRTTYSEQMGNVKNFDTLEDMMKYLDA